MPPCRFYTRANALHAPVLFAHGLEAQLRRCYTLGMLATLMVFHFYHLNVFGNVYELALSSITCLVLYSHKNAVRAFDFLPTEASPFLDGNGDGNPALRTAYATSWHYVGHSRIRHRVLSLAGGS